MRCANQLAGLAAAIGDIDRCRARRRDAASLLSRASARWASRIARSSPKACSPSCGDGARWRRSRRPRIRASSPSRWSCASSGVSVRDSSRDSSSARRGMAARRSSRASARPLAPAVAADLPDWLWDRLGDGLRRRRARRARPRMARARAARPARQSAQDDARRRAARALRGDRASTPTPTPYSPLGIRVDGPAGAGAPSAARGRRDRSAGRGQPARRLPASRRSAPTWSSTSAPAPAARRCCSAR